MTTKLKYSRINTINFFVSQKNNWVTSARVSKSKVVVKKALDETSCYLMAWCRNILDNYIIRCYDVLHTQGKEYLVEDITEFVREKGVLVWLFIMKQQIL